MERTEWEEEIDLRPYVRAILNSWYWIVGASLIAAVVGLAITQFLPTSYEAAVLVAITDSREDISFDSRIRSVEQEQPLRAFPELATSDEMLQILLQQLSPPPENIETPGDMREIVSAESGTDPRIIRLSVRYGDPAGAANIANTWASAYTEWVNGIFSGSATEKLVFFQAQLEDAARELEATEQALIDYEGMNQLIVISNTLSINQELLTEKVSSLDRIRDLQRRTQELQNQLAQQPNGALLSLGDQLAALTIQLAVYSDEDNEPFVLQITGESASDLITSDAATQIDALARLSSALEGRRSEVEEEKNALEESLGDLEQQRRELALRRDVLIRELELAEATYVALANRVNEQKIAAASEDRPVRLASEASIPSEPVESSRLLIVALAGVLGGLLTLLYVLLRMWWHSIESPTDKARQSQ